jgi:hypothetical protein
MSIFGPKATFFKGSVFAPSLCNHVTSSDTRGSLNLGSLAVLLVYDGQESGEREGVICWLTKYELNMSPAPKRSQIDPRFCIVKVRGPVGPAYAAV